MKKIILILSGLFLGLSAVSCDDFLDIEPQGKIIPKTVEDFRNVMSSAYNKYPRHKSLTNFRTDEVRIIIDEESTNFLGVKDTYTYQDVNPGKDAKSYGYLQFYESIFYASQTIISGSQTMQPGDQKEQLLGEAYGLRALAYFDLTNLYVKPYDKNTATTDLAIVLQNEIDIENQKPRSTMAEVYAQIHSDIDNAKKHLKVTIYEEGKNYRFTLAAIYALEAKVNLYQKDYEAALVSVDKALTYKSELQDINTDTKTSVASFKSVESILALEEGLDYSLQTTALVSDELYNIYDRENDLRFATSFEKVREGYISKKTGTGEMKSSFRTSELYIIKAEALGHLNRLAEAKSTIEKLIVSRYKPEAAVKVKQKLSGLDQKGFISFILDERNKEFALEGHRWYDLRRLHQKQIVHKFGNETFTLSENDLRYTLPFPQEARENNPNL
ncbi:RagB/SusD family nutrient uptake outer membrane protein [Myroides marinus]|uniref:RagB/SusD family nutrient uptake outer membrane protein n=1 Tax=Myroides marinus TaxID=703342 RepID=UPI0025774F13|nr:RagB/SusD family nutrient uptake outer membrane protein [Myroides marinus]MDM1367361.1 RagB/SusD family nutrient uptake outer membrane protein [Myroides marinus]MDM1372677.1 RagB/SusD family nutrient uptake outer membrane protein [Myroides marinus]MDM1374590.1 RagB/SusD family nutrient uptake outer membrane protein [Myroides marinus]MDM1381744.1 RagB/SusD family nutrient uptake outer membrane protein [Myroides marinus]